MSQDQLDALCQSVDVIRREISGLHADFYRERNLNRLFRFSTLITLILLIGMIAYTNYSFSADMAAANLKADAWRGQVTAVVKQAIAEESRCNLRILPE